MSDDDDGDIDVYVDCGQIVSSFVVVGRSDVGFTPAGLAAMMVARGGCEGRR
jgi:hypothetical protein